MSLCLKKAHRMELKLLTMLEKMETEENATLFECAAFAVMISTLVSNRSGSNLGRGLSMWNLHVLPRVCVFPPGVHSTHLWS